MRSSLKPGGPLRRYSRDNLRSTLLASTFIIAASTFASAADVQDIGTLGGSQSFVFSGSPISADGTVVVGNSYTTGDAARHAYRWTATGGMVDLGTLGGTNSFATGISADGAVTVGTSALAGGETHAFSWTAGGGMVDLGTLGGTNSTAYAASSNGAIIVGQSDLAGGGSHAVRWSGGVITDLGTLGGTTSEARGVSANGAFIAGTSALANGNLRAALWTGNSITDLGTLGGFLSVGNGISADGQTVVGLSFLAGNNSFHAFRWTGSTGMTDLGTLGGFDSVANAVSANGDVIVGYAVNASLAREAFRWTAASGMKSLAGELAAAGVDMSGWNLESATGVSADGSVVVGFYGTNRVYIARFTAQNAGIITPSEVARSFASLGALGVTGNAAIAGSLGTMSQYATQGLSGGGDPNSRFSVFATGGYDTDPTASGALGVTMKLGRDVIAGAMIEADHIKTNMAAEGSAKMTGGGGGVFLAGIPDTGLQWFTGVHALTIKGDISRGYFNGNTPNTSTGNTTANGFGASARIGWAFDVRNNIKLTPYASYTATSIKYGGYTETTGIFPARIDGFTDKAQTSRLGSDVRYTMAPGKWLWGGLAWAHRLDGGKTPDITGALTGLFPISTNGSAFAQDWAEASIGLRVPFGVRGAVTASVTASVPEKQATTYQFRLGVAQTF